MNEREKILEFTISVFETYKIALTKYGPSEEVTKMYRTSWETLVKLCKELDIPWHEEYKARHELYIAKKR